MSGKIYEIGKAPFCNFLRNEKLFCCEVSDNKRIIRRERDVNILTGVIRVWVKCGCSEMRMCGCCTGKVRMISAFYPASDSSLLLSVLLNTASTPCRPLQGPRKAISFNFLTFVVDCFIRLNESPHSYSLKFAF